MSMRNYSFSDYGIVLNGLVDGGTQEDLAECGIVETQFSFTGDAFPLYDNGNPKYGEADTFNDEAIYYIALQRSPNFFKAAYRDMEELVADMLARYRNMRRKDESHRLPVLTAKKVRRLLRMVDGTYYG